MRVAYGPAGLDPCWAGPDANASYITSNVS